MKQLFQIIGVISLICISFYVTEKTVSVVKEYDDIMIQIKNQKSNYETEAKNAVIVNNTIIPGIKGKTIDENKSYNKMKQYGEYNPTLLEYKETTPQVSINNNYDHYVISGNKNKNQVTLVFLIEENTNVTDILTVLDSKKVKANFFIDSNWLEKNNETMLKLIREGHVIGNLSENKDYQNGNFAWMNTIISKIGNQKQNYCYCEEENVTALKLCAAAKNYTIKPGIVLKNNVTKEIKEKLVAGSIIVVNPTKTNLSELPIMITTIMSKGFDIVNLTNLLSE